MSRMRIVSILIALVAMLAGNSMAIPWPVGETQDEQDMTHTIMNNYGDYHIPWSHACEDSVNFHFGIDFDYPLPTDGSEESENVWSVEAGEVTYTYLKVYNPGQPDQVSEWAIVVCEDEFAEEGWCYQHIEPIPPNTGWRKGDTISFCIQPIATMAELQELPRKYKHLHLMRSLAEYVSSDPALLNPLAYFFPEPVDPDFSWNYFLQAPDKYFFLPNIDAVDPTNQMTGGWLDE